MKARFRQKINRVHAIESLTMPDTIDVFKEHIRKFAAITDLQFQEAMTYFDEVVVAKNDYLIKENARVRQTFWIKKGLLVSTMLDELGKEHIIQFAIENCWITDQNAFYNQQPATLNLIAMEDSELISLSFENREKLCSAVRSMELFFRRKANDSFIKQQKRLITYLTADTRKRYDLLLAEYPNIENRISKKLLAAYLGVSRETLSRL